MNDIILSTFLTDINEIRDKIKEIYLFGSRARGNNKPYSDYDILIVSRTKKIELVDVLYEAVVNILLSYGKVLSLKIYKEDEFNKLSTIPTPFMKKILIEGIKIG